MTTIFQMTVNWLLVSAALLLAFGLIKYSAFNRGVDISLSWNTAKGLLTAYEEGVACARTDALIIKEPGAKTMRLGLGLFAYLRYLIFLGGKGLRERKKDKQFRKEEQRKKEERVRSMIDQLIEEKRADLSDGTRDAEIIRKAMLGEKGARRKCTAAGIGVPCPFCGANIVNNVHPENDCVLRGFEISEKDLEKWNTRYAANMGKCENCAYRLDYGFPHVEDYLCEKKHCGVDRDFYCKNYKFKNEGLQKENIEDHNEDEINE